MRWALRSGDLGRLVEVSDVLLSICPPGAAVDLARDVASHGYEGTYVDANAIAPATAGIVAEVVGPSARYVDGGIIGGPPRQDGSTRLYLAGSGADDVAAVFPPEPLEVIVLSGGPPAASALKIAYASWTKGSAALLLAARAFARAEGVEEDLVVEWARSQPELPERTERLAGAVAPKAWRFVGEMEQIAASFAAAGLPPDFHAGAAEVYHRLRDRKGTDDTTLDTAMAGLLADPAPSPLPASSLTVAAGDRRVGASAAAFLPAMRPNTDPEVRPVPPGLT